MIDLLRHGECVGGNTRYRGRTNDELTPTGWQQMSTRLTSEKPNHYRTIISSPLARCLTFAQAWSNEFDIPLIVDERWQEMDFGAWDGLTSEHVHQQWQTELEAFWRDPYANPPSGGESLLQMQTRVIDAWSDARKQELPALIVTHGGPIRIVLSHVFPNKHDHLLEINVPYASLHSIPASLINL